MRSCILSGSADTVRNRAKYYLSYVGADGMTVVNGAGKVLAEVGSVGAIPDEEPKLKAVGESTEPGWSRVVEAGDRLLLSVTVPVRVGGYVKGTISSFFNIGDQLAKELATGISAEVAFIDRGSVTGSSIPIPGRFDMEESTLQRVQVGSKRLVGVFAPFPGLDRSTPAGFVALRDPDEIAAPYRRFAATFGVVLLLCTLLSLALSARFARTLTLPLDGLVEAAEEVEMGRWPATFDPRRQDEIGILQTAFNSMTQSLRQSQERLMAMVDLDPLTELDNHRRFRERLQTQTLLAATSKEPFCVLLVDMDKFGEFNRTHGHSQGDSALKIVAKTLRDTTAEIAYVARDAGEQFGIILKGHTLDEAVTLADWLRARIKSVLASSGFPDLTVSVGCAAYGPATADPAALVLAAEIALGRAKHLGRDRVSRFDHVPGADETSDPVRLHRFLQDQSLATIQALAAAVDAKDPYTQGHSQRVAKLASDLAAYLGESEADVELVYRTATLHDVGKIGVPDEILKKPGKLTDEERAQMEAHPVLGELIVRKAPQLEDTLGGLRHHHERWDGKGYPDRLKGEKIPKIARILALADTYDAMTSDRPYRPGLPVEVTLAEIESHSGTQFDPELAKAFVAMMRGATALDVAA